CTACKNSAAEKGLGTTSTPSPFMGASSSSLAAALASSITPASVWPAASAHSSWPNSSGSGALTRISSKLSASIRRRASVPLGTITGRRYPSSASRAARYSLAAAPALTIMARAMVPLLSHMRPAGRSDGAEIALPLKLGGVGGGAQLGAAAQLLLAIPLGQPLGQVFGQEGAGLGLLHRLFQGGGQHLQAQGPGGLGVQLEQVAVDGGAQLHPVLQAVQPGRQDQPDGKVGVAGGVGAAQLHAAVVPLHGGDAHQLAAVLAAPADKAGGLVAAKAQVAVGQGVGEGG